MSARIASIQIGQVRTEGGNANGQAGNVDDGDAMNRRWTTAFYKFPVAGRVNVHWLGLGDDEVADLKHHGGPDKAILGYSAQHYAAWLSELLPSDFLDPEGNESGLKAFGAGAFGENLSIDGQTEADVCIGDQYRVGRDIPVAVILEISQPRQPCWKISRRWKSRTLTKRVGQTGRTGWYFRVLREGGIEVGDAMTLVRRPYPAWTIKRANDIMLGRVADQYAVGELMAMPELAASWKASLA